jgi:hypothetical protein
MIKKIAQVINEANLVLNEDFVPDHDDYEIQPQAPGGVWVPPTFEGPFNGEEQHKYSSPDWLQPGGTNPQIESIIKVLSIADMASFTRGAFFAFLRNYRSDSWGDRDENIIIRENLKSLIRFLLRPHGSSGGGNPDDDWIKQIDNESGMGVKNIIFQVLKPLLDGTDFDINPELDHPEIDNSSWPLLQFINRYLL